MAFIVEQHEFILVLAESLVADIADQQRDVLFLALGFAVFEQVFRLGRKAYAIRCIFQCGNSGEDVGVLFEGE
ncbi:hypothetical protein D3C81_2092940 [compost metagenome]